MTTSKRSKSKKVRKETLKARREARAEKTRETLATLMAGVEAIRSGDEWAAYLKFAASFHSYSARNRLLIYSQFPTARRVAGFNKWKELGRHVKKGEKAIRILAPLVRKVESETEQSEESDGETLTFGFRTVSVFDISQTEGEALPSLNLAVECTDEERAIATLESLKDFAENELRIPVSFATLPEATGGYLSLLKREIVINFQSNFLHRAKTLAHEIAHAILHLDEQEGHDEDVMEIEAESVAFCVMSALGFDVSGYSFGYVAGWSGGLPERVLASAERIESATTRTLRGLGAIEDDDRGTQRAPEAAA